MKCTKNAKNGNEFTAEAPRRGGRMGGNERASNIQLNFGSCVGVWRTTNVRAYLRGVDLRDAEVRQTLTFHLRGPAEIVPYLGTPLLVLCVFAPPR